MLMILGVSLQMVESEREIVTREMIRGFNDCATEAQTMITGGQSIMNPWPIIGGVANVVCNEDEYQLPNFGQVGDQLILTKPLGTQVAVNLHEWLIQNNEKWEKSQKLVTHDDAKKAYFIAMESMATLNKNTAVLMKKYGNHGATDITGFGLLGHAQNLANVQREEIDLIIHTLPIIDKMDVINDNILNFKLLTGHSAETSGGILCMISKDRAQDFIREHKEVYGQEAWIVGEVVKGSRKAVIQNKPDVLHIKESILRD